MRAPDPSRALDDWPGNDLRFPEHFQPGASGDDIHNRIHRPNFVKVDLFGWQPVYFTFRHCNPMKDCDRFLLHPGGKRASIYQVANLGKVASMIMLGARCVFMTGSTLL